MFYDWLQSCYGVPDRLDHKNRYIATQSGVCSLGLKGSRSYGDQGVSPLDEPICVVAGRSIPDTMRQKADPASQLLLERMPFRISQAM